MPLSPSGQSLRIKIFAPALTDAAACAFKDCTASFNPSGPWAIANKVDNSAVANPDNRIASSSVSINTGDSNFSLRACSGLTSNKFPRSPSSTFKDMTNLSRRGSMAGFVT